MKKTLFILTIIVCFLQSCSITNSTKLKGNKPLFCIGNFSKNSIESNQGYSSTIHKDEHDVKIENFNEEFITESINELATLSNEIILTETKKPLKLEAGCDKITFMNGNEEEVKLLEIGDDYVKYKQCDNLDGPTFTVSKEKLFMIIYVNGNKEVIEHEEAKQIKEENNAPKYNTQTNYSSEPETNGLAIASFILGILGFIPLGGLILGIIANNQIKNNPSKYKGKGFAAAGIMLSFFWLVLIIALLAL